MIDDWQERKKALYRDAVAMRFWEPVISKGATWASGCVIRCRSVETNRSAAIHAAVAG